MKRYLFIPIPAIALFAGAALAQDPAKTGNSVAAGNESVIEQIGTAMEPVPTKAKSAEAQEITPNLSGPQRRRGFRQQRDRAAACCRQAKNSANTTQDGTKTQPPDGSTRTRAGRARVTSRSKCLPLHSRTITTLHSSSARPRPEWHGAHSVQQLYRVATAIKRMLIRASELPLQPEPTTLT